MTTSPYMPLYISDYLADTAYLTGLEHGAYLMLIMNYWQRGKPLPNDPKKLAGIARVQLSEWDDISNTILEFFVLQDDYWVDERIERELNSIREHRKYLHKR